MRQDMTTGEAINMLLTLKNALIADSGHGGDISLRAFVNYINEFCGVLSDPPKDSSNLSDAALVPYLIATRGRG